MPGPEVIVSPQKGRWAGGINNVDDLHDLGENFVRSAQNVDITTTGKYRRRKGFDLETSGNCHSAWCEDNWPYGLVVRNQELNRIDVLDDEVFLTALMPLASGRKVYYASLNDKVYFSDGTQIGSVNSAGSLVWGVLAPMFGPILIPSSAPITNDAFGDSIFQRGNYRAAFTYEMMSGEESPLSPVMDFQLYDAYSQLSLYALPPMPSGGRYINLYLTSPFDRNLHLVRQFQGSETTPYPLQNGSIVSLAFEQFADNIPPCKHLDRYNGRMYFAVGPRVYYTDPLDYGRFRIHRNYFQYPTDVTMIKSVETGIYVGSERYTVYLDGKDPQDMVQKVVDMRGVIPGTASRVHSEVFGPDFQYKGPVALWWTQGGGLVRGSVGGEITQLTERKVALPSYESGATMFRQEAGIRQLLALLKGPGAGSKFGMTDSASAQVIRNGVVIN